MAEATRGYYQRVCAISHLNLQDGALTNFNVNVITLVCQKDRPNVINLGVYDQERDIAQSGIVGLANLSQLMLETRYN